MNNLRKATLTTLEVAEMMEVSHNDVEKVGWGERTVRMTFRY